MELEYFSKYLDKEYIEPDSQICENLKSLKLEAIRKKDNDLANYIWALEQTYIIRKDYLSVFQYLKSDEYKNYQNAWNLIETINISLGYLYDNFENFSNKYFLKVIRKMIKQYEKLFPYQYFISHEVVIKTEHCSICGERISLRSRCSHKFGKVYMGELCYKVVDDMEIIAIAIVKNPFDKFGVIFPEGKIYDYSILKNLMAQLKSPYDRWHMDTYKEKMPNYKNIGRNQKCPCESGKKYKKCCYESENELMEHHKITLLDNPTTNPISDIVVSTWLK